MKHSFVYYRGYREYRCRGYTGNASGSLKGLWSKVTLVGKQTEISHYIVASNFSFCWNPFQDIWGLHSNLSSGSLLLFSQGFKGRRLKLSKNTFWLIHTRCPPFTLSFHALCKHMHFLFSTHNYFLNFFTSTLLDTSPHSQTKGSTLFSFFPFKLLFQAFSNKHPTSQCWGWIEGRHPITVILEDHLNKRGWFSNFVRSQITEGNQAAMTKTSQTTLLHTKFSCSHQLYSKCIPEIIMSQSKLFLKTTLK